MTGFTDAIAANGLTVLLIYGIWRLKKDESDLLGYLYTLAAFALIGLGVYAEPRPDFRPAPEPQAAQYHTVQTDLR